ncbi:unnamed protein product [Schistocephalus solidus]|uniref:GST N-terminal domain-containing protein n=1 Tax=Schistocephalus solidus TaxID=70667 RepID=A0A183TIC3_SCHSO|nr:unnamed protein product [Schistocephalus solidus]
MYFNMRGRGELLRSILYAAGKEFTDQRIDLRNWLALKPKMPFGQVPTILLTESLAIARLLGRAFQMYGNSPMDIYYIERILSVVSTQRLGRTYVSLHDLEPLDFFQQMNNQTDPFYIYCHIFVHIIEIMNGMNGLKAEIT